ncbi:sigma 54 modulation protein ribosomal protein s30ea [Nannochloropsis gaditana CCMP526]|uniref:sigma 54 modulation protein ribosomal protein s30ea n=1 Tax=Nannochloropsis gaditana (strain CCMP526) TaxID=1093141 RepID=UPI00029F66F0|nr:sigma 54 modulation protein ribosomal protein s30ea [Nannochloropsis gaditana CCMP526]EKU22000.1 sigma 54 modulation protein ribosomal protein s30ea [Nannochloropsis gaditana CCMP526]|eukprot:XP_005854360.1 sigma 54 modulation protein ribosomal protein s30ea [Nannochloropsis gaditana CCMP526]
MQMTKGLWFAAAAATTLILKADAFLPLQPATKYSSHVLPVHLAALTPTSLQPRTGAMRPLTASGGDGNGGETTYKVQVTGNVEVTPAMRDYVEKKLGKVLVKMPVHDAINKVDVHLSVVNLAHAAKHSHTVEATLFMKGGQVLRASEETDYMYASIDLVSHRITRLLRKFKDRKIGKRKEVNFEEDGESDGPPA